MGKYNFSLDMNTRNSLSVILNYIKKNSRILEFGCANGRMTRYMKEVLNCEIDIVEIDYDAGLEAAKYANQKCLGNIEGNIENYYWYDVLNENRYDFIIFADVLEHLYYPARVLRICSNLLKNEGKILISVPNIAHNSIIIGLINDKFTYTDVGLLDNTHIRFFTEESFLSMIDNIGLVVVSEEAINAEVGNIEVTTDYSMISKNLQRELKNREKGNIYQYIFVLQNKLNISSYSRMTNIKSQPPYICECFIQEDKDECYTENKKIMYNVFCREGENKKIEFNLDKFSFIKNIRIDPLDVNCILEIDKIIIKTNCLEKDINNFKTNGIQDGSLYIFGNDPQIFIENINDKVEKVIIEYKVINFEYDDYESFLYYYKESRRLNEILSNKYKLLAYLLKKIKNKIQQINI